MDEVLDTLIKFVEDSIVALTKEKQTWQGEQHFDIITGQIRAYQNMHNMLLNSKILGGTKIMGAPTSDTAGIRQAIRTLKANHWEIESVWDGDEDITDLPTEKSVIEAIEAVGVAHLYVKNKRNGERGFIFFVLGNEPDEVINDYTVNLTCIDKLTESWY